MDQKKLHKLVETIASREFSTEKELLIKVIDQIVENEDIKITGGRIWRLNEEEKSYKILYQTGNFEKLNAAFELKVEENPIFSHLVQERTILGNETNEVLREKGIFRYSASGVGSKKKIDNKRYYEYILALNSENIDENLRLALNIIATSLTSQIKEWRYSKSASHLRANLDEARKLQKSILPEHEIQFGDYEIYGVTKPAEIVGGDFFDYIEAGKENERLGIAIGDAASKGVGAAAEAMYISGALRMASSFEIKIVPLMRRMENFHYSKADYFCMQMPGIIHHYFIKLQTMKFHCWKLPGRCWVRLQMRIIISTVLIFQTVIYFYYFLMELPKLQILNLNLMEMKDCLIN